MIFFNQFCSVGKAFSTRAKAVTRTLDLPQATILFLTLSQSKENESYAEVVCKKLLKQDESGIRNASGIRWNMKLSPLDPPAFISSY